MPWPACYYQCTKLTPAPGICTFVPSPWESPPPEPYPYLHIGSSLHSGSYSNVNPKKSLLWLPHPKSPLHPPQPIPLYLLPVFLFLDHVSLSDLYYLLIYCYLMSQRQAFVLSAESSALIKVPCTQ